MCARVHIPTHVADSNIKKEMGSYKINVVDICMSLKVTHEKLIKSMWNEIWPCEHMQTKL